MPPNVISNPAALPPSSPTCPICSRRAGRSTHRPEWPLCGVGRARLKFNTSFTLTADTRTLISDCILTQHPTPARIASAPWIHQARSPRTKPLLPIHSSITIQWQGGRAVQGATLRSTLNPLLCENPWSRKGREFESRPCQSNPQFGVSFCVLVGWEWLVVNLCLVEQFHIHS